MEDKRYIFFDKTLFFPKEKILIIGDLHFGFDYLLKKAGIPIYKKQIDETKIELTKIFENLNKQNFQIKKIIFLGDLKHSFSYNFLEKKYLNDFFNFLKNKFSLNKESIILIKGNHDTINYHEEINLRNHFLFKDILFLHGDKPFEIIKNKKIKIIVLSHIHPSIIIKDKSGIKKESFKCFLEGKIKNKIFIILPSFLNSSKGFDFSNFEKYQDSFSIIQKKFLKKFNIYIVGENDIFNFGTIKNLINSNL